jgi:arsenate reductase (thioredoxin)
MKRKTSVLFFSTGDATRSRMAAALFKRITEEVEAASTAVQSIGANGLAEEVMREIGVDLSKQPAKSVKQSFQESFAFVVTLSDDSKERSPVWPFTRNLLHWNLPDPGAVDGPVEKKREAFRRMRDEIRSRALELAQRIHPQLQVKARAATA